MLSNGTIGTYFEASWDRLSNGTIGTQIQAVMGGNYFTFRSFLKIASVLKGLTKLLILCNIDADYVEAG